MIQRPRQPLDRLRIIALVVVGVLLVAIVVARVASLIAS
jgi:hypothetical protein